MKILQVAIGNDSEAFIEDRFGEKVNIIFSNDNNKGKTIVMQGIMYSMGYDSIFPSGFNQEKFWFYSKVIKDGRVFEFLRHKNSVIVKTGEFMQICNNMTDFKYFMDKEFYRLPRILKDGQSRLVNLSLLYEIFFVGQDKRNTSNLIVKNQFNKADFILMIYSIMNLDSSREVTDSIRELKKRKREHQEKIKVLKKDLAMIKDNPRLAEITSQSVDYDKFNAKKAVINDLNATIFESKKSRAREFNRKNRLENLIGELRSLNRNIQEGKIECGECGSNKIVYSNDDFSFEVSNTDVRRKIIKSIEESISLKMELINEHTEVINSEQKKLNTELEELPNDLRDIFLYKDEIVNESELDSKIRSLQIQIDVINDELKSKSNVDSITVAEQQNLKTRIVEHMNATYNQVNAGGTLEFEEIFTKNDKNYSGSEEQEFYFSKIIALNKVLEHPFPLIVDSFRDGELSSRKEEKMLEIYRQQNKQVILTSTLKDEEYEQIKYESDELTKVLDYSGVPESHLLSAENVDAFNIIKSQFEGLI